MQLSSEPLANSSQFDIPNQSIEKRELVEIMNKSDISTQSHSSSIQQPKLKTQIINVNEGSQLSINEKKELEELREKCKSLDEENTKLKKQLFIVGKYLKYFLINYKDEILLKNEPNQNSIYINDNNDNDSLNVYLNQSQSLIDLNKSESLNQNRLNLKRSDSNQLNLNTLARPNSQTIVNANDKISKSEKIRGFVNSLIKNNMKNKKDKSKISKDIQKRKQLEEIRKKKEDTSASPFIIKEFRNKNNIPKNITDDEIKIVLINKKFDYDEAAKFLLEKASKIKK